MNKKKKTTSVIANRLILLWAATACTAPGEAPEPGFDAGLCQITQVEVTIPNSTPPLQGGGARSRAEGDMTGSNGTPVTAFAPDDVIEITAYQGTGYQYATLTATGTSGQLTWKFSEPVYVNLTGTAGIEANYMPAPDDVKPADDGYSTYYDHLHAVASAADGSILPQADGAAAVRLNFGHLYSLVEVTTLKHDASTSIDPEAITAIALYFTDWEGVQRKVKLNAARQVIIPNGATLTAIEIHPANQPAIKATFTGNAIRLTGGQHHRLSITLHQNTATAQVNNITPWGEEALQMPTGYNYVVRTADDLTNLATLVNTGAKLPGTDIRAQYAKVIQLADITLPPGTDWVPIGYNVLYYFRGTYNGNGYTITGLRTGDTPTTLTGLFGYIVGTDADNPALLYNIHLRHCQLQGTHDTGALAGSARYAVIAHCSATGTVESTGRAGGLVGYFDENNFLTRSRSACRVTSTGSAAGGLVGSNTYSINTLAACTASGEVTGSTYAGGLLGYNIGPIYFSYATGNAEATATTEAYAGGLVGQNRTGGKIYNSYATGNAAGTPAGTFIGYNSGSTAFTACYATGHLPVNKTVGDGYSSTGVTHGTAPGSTVRGGDASITLPVIKDTGAGLVVENETFTAAGTWGTGDVPTLK